MESKHFQRHTSNGINTLQRHTSYGNKYTCFPGVNWAPTLKFKGLSYEYNKVPLAAWPVRLPARPAARTGGVGGFAACRKLGFVSGQG